MQNNEPLNRFERHVQTPTGDEVVFARYRHRGDTLFIDYVESPPILRGQGEAGKLMAEIMDFAQDKGLKIFPICGYAVAWMRRHPDTEALRAD